MHIDKHKKKMQYIHAMEYFICPYTEDVLPYAATWVSHGDIRLGEINLS